MEHNIDALLSVPKKFVRVKYNPSDYAMSGSPMPTLSINRSSEVYVSQNMFLAEHDPRGHIIYDRLRYPDKPITESGKPWGSVEDDKIIGISYIKRVSVALQQLIAKKNRIHTFGNAPELTQIQGTDEVFKMIKEYFIYKDAHSVLSRLCDSVNSTADGTVIFSRNIDGTLRLTDLSFAKGDIYNVQYGSFGDIELFWREYDKYDVDTTNDSPKLVRYVDVYDNTFVYTYKETKENKGIVNGLKKALKTTNKNWTLVKSERHGFNQVPVCYMKFDDAIWGIVQELIESFEEALTNLREGNSYFAYRILALIGEGSAEAVFPNLIGQGMVINVPEGGGAGYVGGSDVSETVNTELKTLYDLILHLTGTVIIDNNTAKVGSDSSGAAIRNMYSKAVEMAMWRGSYWAESLNKFMDLFIQGMFLEKKMFSEYANTKIGIDIDPWVPQNTMEDVTIINQSVIAGTLSKQSARELHPWASPNENERCIKEETAELQLEATYNPPASTQTTSGEVLNEENQIQKLTKQS